MGVGEMAQMVESVARGVDMFDCVMPTGRHEMELYQREEADIL